MMLAFRLGHQAMVIFCLSVREHLCVQTDGLKQGSVPSCEGPLNVNANSSGLASQQQLFLCDVQARQHQVTAQQTQSTPKELHVIAGRSEAAEPLLGGGWMGTLTNLLLRTLLDVSVTVSNTVIKLCMPHASANLTCQHMQLSTGAGDWKADLQVIHPVRYSLTPAISHDGNTVKAIHRHSL